jgi:hypothetical protein
VTGWGISTCQRRWRELVEVCCESLCGDVEEVRRAVGCRVLPRSYAVSFEGKFPIQVGGKVERR